MGAPAPPWELLAGLAPALELRCRNRSAEPQRLWRLDNSWGWPMPSLELLGGADGPPLARLVPAPRTWTKNLPRFEVVEPGRTLTMVLERGDLVPDGRALAEGHPGAADLWAVARLTSPATPESLALDVWSGEVSSPPFPWRPADPWWQVAEP